MLFATLTVIVFCSLSCFQYRPKQVKPVEIPIEYQVFSPELLDDAWLEVLDSVETSDEELVDSETEESYVDARIRENETWTVDDLETNSQLLPVEDAEIQTENYSFTPVVRSIELPEWSIEDLFQLARENGLKPTARWKRQTLINKLNAIIDAA